MKIWKQLKRLEAMTITDEEFEEALRNKDNIRIIKSVTKKYSGQLSEDTQKSCGLHGLWRCIKNHDDSYGRKFTTSLFMHVDWECKRELCAQNRKPLLSLGESDGQIESPPPNKDVSEILDSLTENQKKIMHQRFFENKTLEEIGKSEGYSKEAARQNINKIILKLRENMSEDFGV